MKEDIEKRLHRVKIELKKGEIRCPHSKDCKSAENAPRCNTFFRKCKIYKKKFKKVDYNYK